MGDTSPVGDDRMRVLLLQARLAEKPIWATRFHPELTGDDNLHRFKIYRSGYSAVMTADEEREALAKFRGSPETEGILPGFLSQLRTRAR